MYVKCGVFSLEEAFSWYEMLCQICSHATLSLSRTQALQDPQEPSWSPDRQPQAPEGLGQRAHGPPQRQGAGGAQEEGGGGEPGTTTTEKSTG